jgi:hypothetical protein
MNQTRIGLGYRAGAILVLSSAAHLLMMGWPGIRAELARSAATPDLVAGVQMAWYFGGMAMLVFGVIVVALFRAAQQGRGVPAAVVAAIGCGYLAFGAIEFIITGYQPFTVIFMLPAALLLAASAPVRRLPAAP